MTPVYGIVRHRVTAWLNYLPETIPMQDRPRDGTGKGMTLPITEKWWRYIDAINDDAGYKYARSIGAMWINGQYDQSVPYAGGKAEAITNSHNFVAFDKFNGTNGTLANASHGHLLSWDLAEDPFLSCDPILVNWYTRPWLFFKAIATRIDGKHINPGRGINCYLPVLHRTNTYEPTGDRWLALSRVELFPALPFYGRVGGSDLNLRSAPGLRSSIIGLVPHNSSLTINEYRPMGCSVWGRLGQMGWVCLLLAEQPGQRQLLTTWTLKTAGVIPPPATVG